VNDAAQEDTGAELLWQDIQAQADRERAEIDARAEQQLQQARERAEEEIRRVELRAEREWQGRIEGERETLLGRNRLEERRARLAARRQSLDRVFTEAGRRIQAARQSEGYAALLGRLVREALLEAGTGAELVVSASEEPLCTRLLRESGLEAAVRGEEGLPPGTVLALSADGRRRVDNGLERRLERARAVLEDEVARLLWGTTTT
jgi:vacuolar-type H+-ATPase subunit E/Vma4